MKKIIIAMAAIAAAFTMASCNKEQPVSPNENPTVGKSVITATIENDLTKAYLDANGNDTDGYKVFWSAGDKLFVGSQDEIWYAEYTLDEASAGSSNGTFCWKEGAIFHSKTYSMPEFEVDWRYSAYYPFSINVFDDEGNFIGGAWKTEQTYADMYIPMFAAAECTEEGKADFVFTNLGGLLRLTVKGTATIRSIELRAAETMSGAIDCMSYEGDGYIMLIKDDTHGGIHYVTLDCGKDGVELNDEEGTDFYFSLPCCFDTKNWEIDGYSDVTITLTDTDGKTCVKKLNNKKLFIERSQITTATFTASEWILPGKFSVAEGKQVQFSSGNLTATVDATGAPTAWKFAANQYDYLGEGGANKTIGTAAGDIDLFGWSNSAIIYGISTSMESLDYSGDFVDWGENIGDGKTWRTLTTEEWQYLLNSRTVNGGIGEDKSYSINITYGGKMGFVLYPDDYVGDAISGNVDSLPEGVVFLPETGFRHGSDVEEVGVVGNYWTSSTDGENQASFVFINSDLCQDTFMSREYGFSVRLITDVK